MCAVCSVIVFWTVFRECRREKTDKIKSDAKVGFMGKRLSGLCVGLNFFLLSPSKHSVSPSLSLNGNHSRFRKHGKIKDRWK